MPRTKLADKLELEKSSVEHLVQRIEKLEQKGKLTRVPGTTLLVDLDTGLVYLSEEVLAKLKQSVDNR